KPSAAKSSSAASRIRSRALPPPATSLALEEPPGGLNEASGTRARARPAAAVRTRAIENPPPQLWANFSVCHHSTVRRAGHLHIRGACHQRHDSHDVRGPRKRHVTGV